MRLRISELVRTSANCISSPYAVAVATVVALTIASGIVHGRLSGRWHSHVDDLRLEKKLEEFPRDFGSWQFRESLSLAPTAQNMLECRSYLYRNYVHRDTGRSVTVAVLVGPAGPISVHTPEICYSSREYQLRDERVQVTTRVNATQAQLWKTTLYPTGTDPRLLRVYYGWNDGHSWKAPAEPRFSFIGIPRLYKIQLAALLPPVLEAGDDPCSEFLEQFLPVLEQYLARSEGQP